MPKRTSSTHSATRTSHSAQLLYAASDTCADLLYLSGIFVPDPFIAFIYQDKSYGIFNILEISRARKESKLDHILSLETTLEDAHTFLKKSKKALSIHYAAQIIIYLAAKLKIKSFQIPSTFPAGLAFELQNIGLKLSIGPTPFFPKRLIKTLEEIKAIREGNQASAAGIAAAEKILQASIIKKNNLYYKGKILTSEIVRNAVNIACLERGSVANNTIVAGGSQACDPHCIGFGPLRANEFIIVDVFPRITATGYHGDMTRTFLKGNPNEAQKALIHTVQKAQKVGLSHLKAGITGAEVNQKVTDFFDQQGYKTVKQGNAAQGFIHSTGHGLGLDIHEEPSLSRRGASALQADMVVTVEPGLYYPEIGGVRIEDVAAITLENYKLLSKSPYKWHIL